MVTFVRDPVCLDFEFIHCACIVYSVVKKDVSNPLNCLGLKPIWVVLSGELILILEN